MRFCRYEVAVFPDGWGAGVIGDTSAGVVAGVEWGGLFCGLATLRVLSRVVISPIRLVQSPSWSGCICLM